MKALYLVALTTLLNGCSALLMPDEQEAPQPTTVVDAIEGDKSQPESNEGLVDSLRGRADAVADDPAWAPIYPMKPEAHYAAETGSLFSQATAKDLYNDKRPHSVGDIITVNLDESTNASKSANADLSKSNDASMDPLSVGGQELKVGDYNFSYGLSNQNNFTGDASANQSNSLSGAITVQVIQVLSNGNLVIRGEKWMTLNTGDEYIRLSGTIRPDDIEADNTIASNRVSNARIQYSATGDQQDMQQPGFLARFFNIAL